MIENARVWEIWVPARKEQVHEGIGDRGFGGERA